MLIHIYWTNIHSFDLHSNAPNWRKGRLKPARLFRKDKFIFEVKATEIIDIKSCVIVKIYHDKELSPTESVGSKSGNQRPGQQSADSGLHGRPGIQKSVLLDTY